jgi:hypothetical protein
MRSRMGILCWALAAWVVAESREWKSTVGTSIEGSLVEVEGETVHLRGADGVARQVPLRKLSLADRDFLAKGGKLSKEVLVREWNTSAGHKVLAQLIDCDGERVFLEWDNNARWLPLAGFVEEDQRAARAWHTEKKKRDEAAADARAKEMLKLPFVDLKPGGGFQRFNLPVPEDLKAMVREPPSPIGEIRAGIAVPADFDPSKPHPIFVGFTSSSAGGTHMAAGARYSRATKKGWVVIAAGGMSTDEERSYAFTTMALLTLFRALEEHWPGVSTWPIAAGGFSGGAKWAGMEMVYLGLDGFNPIGAYKGGCNQMMLLDALAASGGDKDLFREMAIFISNGTQDGTANASLIPRMTERLRAGGIDRIRGEPYEGKHSENMGHFEAALDWFLEIHPLEKSRQAWTPNQKAAGLHVHPDKKPWVKGLRSSKYYSW